MSALLILLSLDMVCWIDSNGPTLRSGGFICLFLNVKTLSVPPWFRWSKPPELRPHSYAVYP
jgi:hypothetical protein